MNFFQQNAHDEIFADDARTACPDVHESYMTL